jgi:tRNA A-37 threonylcarbamoyl transferase component Bud32
MARAPRPQASPSDTLVDPALPPQEPVSRSKFQAALTPPPPVELDAVPLADGGFDDRYAHRAVLGVGGMGEVRLCKDQRIGREVAMKVVRPFAASHSEMRARFEREARVQGQLEHPAIVPVYDLGIGPNGAAYFTMKRIRGRTLEEIIIGLRGNDPEIVEGYPLRRLLVAFSRVCLAVAFAHTRGVVHRDLKPSNVMIGDFGEVYVLDWGLAKVLGEPELDIGEDDATVQRPAYATLMGKVLGTPGYMAPEQVRGDEIVDARADIYALGATLFEVLALEPLHVRTQNDELFADTLKGGDARVTVRAPDRGVGPELEAICVKATALDPHQRHDSARALADDVERFLDGDRDLTRRRALADVAAKDAAQAAERARRRGEPGLQARAQAIRDVNRALALEPTHKGALGTMLRLLLEPPAETPKEAEAALAASRIEKRATSARAGAFSFLSTLVVVPFVLWLGVRNWAAAAVTFSTFAASALFTWWIGRSRGKGNDIAVSTGTVALFISMFAIGASSLLFGPFVIVPGMAAINTLSFAVVVDRGVQRSWAVLVGTLAVFVPLVLELVHVLPPSFAFREGAIVLLPRMTEFPAMPTILLLIVANLVLVLVPTYSVTRLFDGAQEAERRTFVHLWHLRQFLPDEARSATGG